MDRNISGPDELGSRSCLGSSESQLEGNEAAESTAKSLLDRLPASKAEFQHDLQSFCAARGIAINLRPLAGNRAIDLFDLFQSVARAGGYDSLSDPDSGARNWKELCEGLRLQGHLSFQVKEIYLKNLAAYEIYKLHGRQPPTVDLLEELPPVGGNLLSRTVEEYRAVTESRRFTTEQFLQQRYPSQASDAVQGFFSLYLPEQVQQASAAPLTLSTDSQGVAGSSDAGQWDTLFDPSLLSDEPADGYLSLLGEQQVVPDELPDQFLQPSSLPSEFTQSQPTMATNTRSSLREGLRQAPKVNQPFVPDTAPVRQTRSSTHAHTPTQHNTASPQPASSQSAGLDQSSNPSSANFNLEHFEGKETKQAPMSTREVVTPGNRPAQFAAQNDKAKTGQQPDFYDPYYPLEHLEIPRTDGIYRRCYYGLQSGIPDEVDFALYHLVQISNQRCDKFKFEGFPLLAETLMDKAMEITLLCSGVKWELDYISRRLSGRINVLNSLGGTSDLLDRLKSLPLTYPRDTLETEEFSRHLRHIKEATLVLRNMCLLQDNVLYVTQRAKGLLRDFLVVLLNIPQDPRFNELKNDALDIAEEVTKYLQTQPDDPLCISLFNCLDSHDRAHVVRALSALAHFSTELEQPTPSAMECVPLKCLQSLFYYTLIEQDKDVLSGALDLLYQYTLSRGNVEKMIDQMPKLPRVVIGRTVSLLSYEAKLNKEETVLQEEKVAPPPSEIPKVPPELYKALIELPEPERSSRWLRCCFVEDSECEITQIALWQGYQSRFADARLPGGGVLPAAEFIKNVSTTFTNAHAQVINGPGTATKFIIKGIRPLETAHTFDGWPYLYCKWTDDTQPSKQCNRAFATPTELRSHVFEDHMGLKPLDQPAHYNLEKADKPIHTCQWDNCTKFKSSGPSDDTAMVAEHVASHLPQDRDPNAKPPSTQREILQPRVVRTWDYIDTPLDTDGEPYGVAYKAALIMRNLAWHLPTKLKKDLFTTHRTKIIETWDLNRSLRRILTDLIILIDKEEK